MIDETEEIRRKMVMHFPSELQELEKQYGQVWNTREIIRDFSVEGFMAPFVVVTRKSDKQHGSLLFQDSPRYYYSFRPEDK